jgi:hypothetical protein
LAGLENLTYLNLYGTKVTDAGLSHLKSLAKLRRLYVWQTQVTAAGADALKAALPELQVNLGAELAAPPPAEESEEAKPDADAKKPDAEGAAADPSKSDAAKPSSERSETPSPEKAEKKDGGR